ncbi:unnamed protein product [Alternaria alternata]
MEMITIQESVIDTFDGLRMMRLRDQFVLKQDDEDVAVWSRKLEVSVRKSNQVLEQLLEQQSEVKVQLAQLTLLVTMENQQSVRLENVNDRGSMEDRQSAASVGQQGSVQPSVEDENAQT